MNGSTLRRCAGLALCFTMALGAASAQATLYGVAHQIAEGRESLVRVSVADAAITDNAQVALANCCRVSGALLASDDATQTAYFITPNDDPALAWQFHRISLASGTAATVNLPLGEKPLALLRRPSPATTLALSDNGSGLRLVSISDAGAVSAIGAAILTNCCALRVGVAALSTDASRIAFVARLLPAAGDPAPRLIVVNTGSGALLVDAVLAKVPDVLVGTGASTFAAIYHDAGTEFFGNLANDGSVTPVGSGQANCCKVYAGVSARNANRLRFVGGDLGSSAARLFEVNTATGVFSEIGALNAAYVIHGLLESNVNLASDVIFQDGFENAMLLAQGEEKSMAVDAALVASGMPDSADSVMGASAALAGSSTNASIKDVDQVTGGPQQVTELPGGNLALWSVLVMLLALVGMRHRRRHA